MATLRPVTIYLPRVITSFRNRVRYLRGLWSLLAVVIILLLLALSVLLPRNNIVTVEADTEIVSYKVVNTKLSIFDVEGADLYSDPFSSEPTVHIDQAGSYIRLTENTNVEIRKRENDDVVYITLSTKSLSVGSIYLPNGSISLGPWANLSIDLTLAPLPRLLPFRGKLTLGEDVAPGIENILLSGSVSIAEQQLGLFSRERYLLLESKLEKGDRVLVRSATKDEEAVSDGFVRVTYGETLSVVAHTSDGEVHVIRFGSAGYRISPSVWARVINDPSLSWVTALLGILLLSVELILAITQIASRVVDHGGRK